jgi:hypothetical protein
MPFCIGARPSPSTPTAPARTLGRDLAHRRSLVGSRPDVRPRTRLGPSFYGQVRDRRYMRPYPQGRRRGRVRGETMGAGIGLGVGLGLAAGLYILGRVLGAGGNPPTGSAGTNSTEVECDAACNQWDARRQERCNLEKDEVTARSRADALRISMLATLATATSLAAAAAAAATIPFFGTAIAAALAASAAVFFAIAAVTAGQLGAAEIDLAAKAGAAQGARNAEADARAIMAQKCPPDRADACLLRPSPC